MKRPKIYLYLLTLLTLPWIADARTSTFQKAAAQVRQTSKEDLIKPLYQLPIPADQVTISSFSRQGRVVKIAGYTHRGNHYGIDFSSSGKRDVPVLAAADGEIVQMVNGCSNGGPKRCGSGFGNFIKIKHSDGTFTMYAHLNRYCKARRPLKVGQKVTAGQQIGCIGNSGMSSGYHLCFRAYDENDRPIFPELLLGAQLAQVNRKDSVKVPAHLASIKPIIQKGVQ